MDMNGIPFVCAHLRVNGRERTRCFTRMDTCAAERACVRAGGVERVWSVLERSVRTFLEVQSSKTNIHIAYNRHVCARSGLLHEEDGEITQRRIHARTQQQQQQHQHPPSR